jgi:hypothetical protein
LRDKIGERRIITDASEEKNPSNATGGWIGLAEVFYEGNTFTEDSIEN